MWKKDKRVVVLSGLGEAYAVDGTWGKTGVALAADPI
jgi:hypothetical protein